MSFLRVGEPYDSIHTIRKFLRTLSNIGLIDKKDVIFKALTLRQRLGFKYPWEK